MAAPELGVLGLSIVRIWVAAVALLLLAPFVGVRLPRRADLALIVACEGHPPLVPRIRRYLDRELNLRESQQTEWRRHWTLETLTALEGHLAGHKDTGRFCHGDTPTLADICLAGHATVAAMLQIDLKPWPTVKRIYETAMAMPEFATAHPLAQPDTPEAMRPKK